jgi:hypothetical protein
VSEEKYEPDLSSSSEPALPVTDWRVTLVVAIEEVALQLTRIADGIYETLVEDDDSDEDPGDE